MNPFLFMNAILVEHIGELKGEQMVYNPIPGNPIIGQNVSSLHRLKDVDNKGKYLSTYTSIVSDQINVCANWLT